jgi:hypothetical protein
MHLSEIWNESEKAVLVHGWHKLNGTCYIVSHHIVGFGLNFVYEGWPDSSQGLYRLKKLYIICTLSNGNVRLLADMVRFPIPHNAR